MEYKNGLENYITDDDFLDNDIENLPNGTEIKDKLVIPKLQLFYNDDTGFGIYICEDAKDVEENLFPAQFKISGVFVEELVIGQTYKIKGVVDTYKDAKQIKVSDIRNNSPIGKRGVINYLKTLKGLKERAHLIFAKYGDKSIDMILKKPDVVANEIKGISLKSVLSWKEQLEKNLVSQYAMSFMLDLSISLNNAKKLYLKYKDSSVSRLQNNPYFLMDELKGYGFEKCDKIARNVGLNPKSDVRIKAGILYTLKKASESDGHCYLPLKELISKSIKQLNIRLTEKEMQDCVSRNKSNFLFYWSNKRLDGDNLFNSIDNGEEVDYTKLVQSYNNYKKEKYYAYKDQYRYVVYNFSYEKIKEMLYELSATNEIVIDKCKERQVVGVDLDDNDRIYLKNLYNEEVYVADKIIELNNKVNFFSRDEVEQVLDEVLKERNIILEEEQREACIEYNTFKGGFCLLIGNAGTGKTFVLKILLEVKKRLFQKIKVATTYQSMKPLIFAPTGKASKVASRNTKMDCKTIHRGLGCVPGLGFKFNESNPLIADVLIIDETSMLDLNITYHLLKAVKQGTQVIFMGDIKQLISVGCGNILRDIIDSNTVVINMLKVCKRQGVFSGINLYADNVINEIMIPKQVDTKDAYFIDRDTSKGCFNAIVTSIKKMLNRDGYSMDDIQVLAPQRKGSVGIYALNYVIQKQFNPENNDLVVPWISFEFNNRILELNFKKGDKVIHTKNDYEMDLYYKRDDGTLEKLKDEGGITNGECGVIENIYKNPKTKDLEILVKYDDFYCIYAKDLICELELAWALTIHKSQGSEWKCVILCISSFHSRIMLDSSLLYTGITRASDFLAVIGDSQAILKCLKTHNIYQRYTYLKQRLIERNKLLAI